MQPPSQIQVMSLQFLQQHIKYGTGTLIWGQFQFLKNKLLIVRVQLIIHVGVREWEVLLFTHLTALKLADFPHAAVLLFFHHDFKKLTCK